MSDSRYIWWQWRPQRSVDLSCPVKSSVLLDKYDLCHVSIVVGVFFQQLHVLGKYYCKSKNNLGGWVAVSFYIILCCHSTTSTTNLCQVTRFSAPNFKFESSSSIESNVHSLHSVLH